MDFTVAFILTGEEAIMPMILSGDLIHIMDFMDLAIIVLATDMAMDTDIMISDMDYPSIHVFMVEEYGITPITITLQDIIISDKMSLITQEGEALLATVLTAPQQLEMLRT